MAPIPVSSTLKVISGQKVVLNNDDKILCYVISWNMDAIASILEDVT